MELTEQVSQRQLATLIGVSPGRVSQLIAQDVIPRDGGMGVQVSAYCEHLRSVAAGRSEAPELTVERARLVSAQADIAQFERDELDGSLIRVDAVRRVWAGAMVATRESLLQVPARLAAVVAAESDPAAVHTLLAREVHQALLNLSRGSYESASGIDAAVDEMLEEGDSDDQ